MSSEPKVIEVAVRSHIVSAGEGIVAFDMKSSLLSGASPN